jgi:hypothetical protein
LNFNVLGRLNVHVPIQFQKTGIHAVFESAGATDSPVLFDYGPLGSDNDAVLVVVNHLFGANDGKVIQLHLNVPAAREVIRRLVIGAVRAVYRSRRVLAVGAENRHVDVLKNVLVVLEGEALFRSHDELGAAALLAHILETVGADRHAARQLRSATRRIISLCAPRIIVPRRHSHQGKHKDRKDRLTQSNDAMCKDPL